MLEQTCPVKILGHCLCDIGRCLRDVKVQSLKVLPHAKMMLLFPYT